LARFFTFAAAYERLGNEQQPTPTSSTTTSSTTTTTTTTAGGGLAPLTPESVVVGSRHNRVWTLFFCTNGLLFRFVADDDDDDDDDDENDYAAEHSPGAQCLRLIVDLLVFVRDKRAYDETLLGRFVLQSSCV
jgi:hypothetical protein